MRIWCKKSFSVTKLYFAIHVEKITFPELLFRNPFKEHRILFILLLIIMFLPRSIFEFSTLPHFSRTRIFSTTTHIVCCHVFRNSSSLAMMVPGCSSSSSFVMVNSGRSSSCTLLLVTPGSSSSSTILVVVISGSRCDVPLLLQLLKFYEICSMKFHENI